MFLECDTVMTEVQHYVACPERSKCIHINPLCLRSCHSVNSGTVVN